MAASAGANRFSELPRCRTARRRCHSLHHPANHRTSTALSGVYLVLSAAPTASVGTLDAAVSLYECIRMADVLGSCGSRFIRLGLHRIYKITSEKLELFLKEENFLVFFCEK